MVRVKCDHSTPVLDAAGSRVGMERGLTQGLEARHDRARCGRVLSDVDPGFGGDEVEGETDPEGGAEEFARGEVGEAAGGEEDAGYGTDGGYCEAGREGPDHPLAMEGDFAAANVPEGLAEREEEEGTEQRGGRGLI